MLFRIHFNQEVYPPLYEDYCKFLFEEIKSSIRKSVNPRKYRVREKLVINSKVLKWKVTPESLDLTKYVNSCLEMVKVKGDYVIRLNQKTKVDGSLTKVSTLIRLLEYGNEKIPPVPTIRNVFRYYSENYGDLLSEFFERRMKD